MNILKPNVYIIHEQKCMLASCRVHVSSNYRGSWLERFPVRYLIFYSSFCCLFFVNSDVQNWTKSATHPPTSPLRSNRINDSHKFATEQQMEVQPLEDKWQVVAELRSILAIAGIPMKSRTVNALVEIIDARPNVSVETIMTLLEELKKIKTYSVLINR